MGHRVFFWYNSHRWEVYADFLYWALSGASKLIFCLTVPAMYMLWLMVIISDELAYGFVSFDSFHVGHEYCISNFCVRYYEKQLV